MASETVGHVAELPIEVAMGSQSSSSQNLYSYLYREYPTDDHATVYLRSHNPAFLESLLERLDEHIPEPRTEAQLHVDDPNLIEFMVNHKIMCYATIVPEESEVPDGYFPPDVADFYKKHPEAFPTIKIEPRQKPSDFTFNGIWSTLIASMIYNYAKEHDVPCTMVYGERVREDNIEEDQSKFL